MSDILNQSDDDFLKEPFPETEEVIEEDFISDDGEEEEAQQEQDTIEEAEEEIVEETDTSLDNDDVADEETTEKLVDDVTDNSDKDLEEVTEETKKEPDAKTDSTFDYESAYKKLTTPFKANGREIKVENVDEAIQLMQMGANYNKKMAALKPKLKVLRMLEDNGLLDESKLSFYIDVEKKNPDAIQKLIKDSGIDPLDIDTTADTKYKPNTYTVDEREIALEEILEEIKDTPSYSKTMKTVSSEWDSESKKVLLTNPTIIRDINEHIQNGIYDQVMAVVEKERMLGRLTGLSDLAAYKTVGDTIFAGQSQQPEKPVQKQVARPVSKGDDPAIKQRKMAASIGKPSVSKATPMEFNPLALSDEEFEKLAGSKFI